MSTAVTTKMAMATNDARNPEKMESLLTTNFPRDALMQNGVPLLTAKSPREKSNSQSKLFNCREKAGWSYFA